MAPPPAAATIPPKVTKQKLKPPIPPAEDAAGDGGETIDTFSSYMMPTASLPKCLLNALADIPARSEPSTHPTAHAQKDSDVQDNSGGPSSSSGVSVTLAALQPNDSVIDLCESDASNHASETINESGDAMDTTQQSNLIPSIPSHTSPACESALLASVSAPRAPEEAGEALLEAARSGALSPLQLEGAVLAISRHRRLFKKDDQTVRAGFFLGDGAGVGKGRQIAAVLRDSFCRGRTRHVWVSVSRELCLDAQRDLRDLGCHVDVHDGSDLLNQTNGGSASKGLGAGGSLGKGVLFVTYPLLVSGKGKRMEEVIKWLSGGSAKSKNKAEKGISHNIDAEHAFDGLIVFDEAHRAKNMDAGTQTAKLVIELQARLPSARVLYCSATGVSDLKHMVYATRLGLWGAGNPMYPDFPSFHRALTNRGVGSLEMLALEMKQKGAFLARTLAWDGAEFNTMEVKLGEQQTASYDAAVEWWIATKKNIEIALTRIGNPRPKMLWPAYWSAHQRFFKELCICAKLPELVAKAQKYLDEGCAVVIGLQSTGEKGTQFGLEEMKEQALLDSNNKASLSRHKNEDVSLTSLLSTSRSVMLNFVTCHFPVTPLPQEAPKLPPMPSEGFKSDVERNAYMHLQAEAERIKNLPPPKPIKELLKLRQSTLDAIKALTLPPNPLDDLIDRLGGVDRVAEMTGRSGRVVRTGENKFKYAKRIGAPAKQKYGLDMPTAAEDADRLNIVEKRKFMEGKKCVAIISDAASTGISLHAAENSGAAHKRRVHFTIELPWAADKAIQQLGRSHRSGQRSAPIYEMVVTELGGERRFAAAVSKRMASLGALTKGDRRAATGSDLSDFDIDSQFGRRALKRVYSNLRELPPSAPSRNSTAILDEFVQRVDSKANEHSLLELGLEAHRASALTAAAAALERVGLTGDADVKAFLNRIMGLDVKSQNLVFSLFMSTLDDGVADAKSTGEFEGSVEEIKATSVTLKEDPTTISTDRSSGVATILAKITLDRGISFEQVLQNVFDDKDKHRNASDNDWRDSSQIVAESGFYLSKRKIAGRKLVMFAKRKVDQDANMEFSRAMDPLGSMIISRPNTGKNPCEMSSRDLHTKYVSLFTSKQIIRMLIVKDDTEESSKPIELGENFVAIVREKCAKLAGLWDDAYSESNHTENRMGLAPRISHIGLVTGAVLHILPALEKATVFMTDRQRALKVMRVEFTDSGKRIVGIKFPLQEDAIEKLLKVLAHVSSTTDAGTASVGVSFVDQPFVQIDAKYTAWATTERKTMRSFFASKTPVPGTKRKTPPQTTSITPSPMTKKATKSASQKQNKKSSTITSFFAKK